MMRHKRAAHTRVVTASDRRDALLNARIPLAEPSEPDAAPHWACVDCGAPCYCSGALRVLAHRRCGVPETIVGYLHELRCTKNPCTCAQLWPVIA